MEDGGHSGHRIGWFRLPGPHGPFKPFGHETAAVIPRLFFTGSEGSVVGPKAWTARNEATEGRCYGTITTEKSCGDRPGRSAYFIVRMGMTEDLRLFRLHARLNRHGVAGATAKCSNAAGRRKKVGDVHELLGYHTDTAEVNSTLLSPVWGQYPAAESSPRGSEPASSRPSGSTRIASTRPIGARTLNRCPIRTKARLSSGLIALASTRIVSGFHW